MKIGNVICFLLCTSIPCAQLHLLFIEICFMGSVTVSNLVVLILSASFLLFHYFPVCPLCFCLCVYVCICLYFLLFICWPSVSPCWQRGITAPGIESSSQASGWRSTSQMKRMLVLLKVAAELPVDAFAVTLSVLYNPGWFVSFSRISTKKECGFYFVFLLSLCCGLLFAVVFL